jgi:hypothetical protein
LNHINVKTENHTKSIEIKCQTTKHDVNEQNRTTQSTPTPPPPSTTKIRLLYLNGSGVLYRIGVFKQTCIG